MNKTNKVYQYLRLDYQRVLILRDKSKYNQMKVTIKSFTGQTLKIEMQEQQTIGELKQKIERGQGIAAERQKLYFKRKTMKNEDVIGRLGMKGRDYLVLKDKTKQKKDLEEKVEEKVEHSPEPVERNQQQYEQQQQQFHEAGTRERKQQRRQEIKRESGAISPPNQDPQNSPQNRLYNSPQSRSQNSQQNVPNSQNALSALTAMPQFSEIRAAMQRNHGVNTSPQLYNLIIQHPEQFQQLSEEGEQEGEQSRQIGQFQVQDESVQNLDSQQVRASLQQNNAIERLCSLGFNVIQATLAYLECNRDEEMAGNLLFDRQANGVLGNSSSSLERALFDYYDNDDEEKEDEEDEGQ